VADSSSRTEKPTPKRRREARRKGQVARTPDLGAWLALLVVSFVLPTMVAGIEHRVVGLVAAVTSAMAHPSTTEDLRLLGTGLEAALFAALPFVAIATVVGTAVATAQVGLHLTTGTLWQPKHLSPIAGFKRFLSPNGAFELAKQATKLFVLTAVAWVSVHSLIDALRGPTPPLTSTLAVGAGAIVAMVRAVALAGLLIAIADFAYQRHRNEKQLKMSRHEVKEELRQSEGSPEVKAAQRRRRRLTRSKMLAEVAKATAVVTNPTHLAVALRYERGADPAPRVVAKGLGELAQRIREEAIARGVPIVENPPLAWTIHGACEVDDTIPPDLYEAVARLLAFVYRLSPLQRSLVSSHRMGD
jgi:flagellar biosynthetic protein FlhB